MKRRDFLRQLTIIVPLALVLPKIPYIEPSNSFKEFLKTKQFQCPIEISVRLVEDGSCVDLGGFIVPPDIANRIVESCGTITSSPQTISFEFDKHFKGRGIYESRD